MEEKSPNFFMKVYKSIADFSYYKNIVTQTVGKAILYLVLLTLILGLISVIKPVYDYNRDISLLTNNFDKDIPDFSFKNGQLNVSGKMPIIIESRNSTVIIDTSGNTNESALDNYHNGVLFLKDKMIQKSGSRTSITNFSSLTGFSLTRADVKGLLPILKWFSIFIILFGPIIFIAGKFLGALIISLIGLIINLITGAKLSFGNIFKLSIYSITLTLFLKVIAGFTPVSIPLFWLISYLPAIVYLWYAMILIKKENQTALV